MLGDDDPRVGALDESDGEDLYSLDEVDEIGSETRYWDEQGYQAPVYTEEPLDQETIRIGGSTRDSRGRANGDSGGGRNVPLSVATGIAFAVVAAILFKLGPATSLVLAVAIVVLAAVEFYAVLRRAGYRPATLLGLAASAAVVIGAYLKGETALPLAVVLTVIFTLLWYLWGVVRARPTINVATTLVVFLWVGVLGSYAGLILDPRAYPSRHGVAILLGAVLATVGYDVGGLIFGSLLGRHV